MKKKLPIGISDFREIIENNYYYVDKSLLVKDIDESGKVVLATRPRRFGKTLNLSLLRYFYEINESTAHLFNDLAIGKIEKYRAMQGQFPVIFVTFKNIFQPTHEALMQKISETLAQEFDRHAYLLSSSELNYHEKEKVLRFQTESAGSNELGGSLEFLSNVLHKHFKRKVIVLIDEYDVPVQAAYVHGFYEKLILFMKELLTGVLKDKPSLEKGVLTGIMTLAKAGILTGLNNLDIYNLTDPLLADKFGFTSDEAAELLNYYEIDDPETIKQWYNGYIFGKTNGMYNPWSILKCVQNKGACAIYWANTSDNVLLRKLIARSSSSTKSELEHLLTGETIEKTIEESIIYPDADRHQELIWSILLFTGYLTYTDYTLKEGKKLCSLTIPNKEITFLYRDLIRKLFMDSVVGGQAQDLLQALTEGNTQIFSQLLKSFVLNSMSTYDLSSAEPEKSYHLFVLGLLVMLSDTYEVTSNRESGLGRYDILITPKDKQKPGIVIEFKKVWNEKDTALEDAAQKALDQIIERKYAQELYSKGIEKIFAYGIAFERKNICVKSCTLERPAITC